MDRVVITGVERSVGAAVATTLARHYDVVGLHDSRCAAASNLSLETCVCNLGDAAVLADVVRSHTPAHVVHCGALARSSWNARTTAELADLAAEPAVTRARVLERFGSESAAAAALVECWLETGRTHQIRVHMAFAGHPLVGDTVYGRRRTGVGPLDAFPRQALHAHRLSFQHPVDGRPLTFEAPLPADLSALVKRLRAACRAEARRVEATPAGRSRRVVPSGPARR